MDGPKAGEFGGEAFQPDGLALDGFDQAWAARIAQIAEGRVPLDGAFAHDGNQGGVAGREESAVAFAQAAFPTPLDERIISGVRTADEGGALFQPQRGVRADDQAADEVIAGGHNDFIAAGGSTGVECFLKSGGVLDRAVAAGAKQADVEDTRLLLQSGAAEAGGEQHRKRQKRKTFAHGRRLGGRKLRFNLKLRPAPGGSAFHLLGFPS